MPKMYIFYLLLCNPLMLGTLDLSTKLHQDFYLIFCHF